MTAPTPHDMPNYAAPIGRAEERRLRVRAQNRLRKLNDRLRMPGASRVNEAIGMLDRLTHAEELVDFLTLPAYERID